MGVWFTGPVVVGRSVGPLGTICPAASAAAKTVCLHCTWGHWLRNPSPTYSNKFAGRFQNESSHLMSLRMTYFAHRALHLLDVDNVVTNKRQNCTGARRFVQSIIHIGLNFFHRIVRITPTPIRPLRFFACIFSIWRGTQKSGEAEKLCARN